MMYIFALSTLNIIITTTMLWLVAHMFNMGWNWAQCAAITALFIVVFGGVVGSMRDFRSLAERRLLFNVAALGCVILAYMLSG